MPGGVAYPLMEDQAGLKETLARLEATGITVADLEVVALRPETEIAAFSAFFETGARLGARHILVAAYDPRPRPVQGSLCGLLRGRSSYGLSADLEFMPWTYAPDLSTANSIVAQVGQPNAGVLVDALHFDRSRSSIDELARVPAHRLHYWQICDGPAERPTTTEAMLHAARYERMFPGEAASISSRWRRRHAADITVSIEVPTAELAKTMDAKARAQRALTAARNVIAGSRDPRSCCT